MKVSPFYQGIGLPRSDFPKLDPFCQDFPPDLSLPPAQRQPPLCTLDVHPYAGDLQETARAVSRGDTLSRTTWDHLSRPAGVQAHGSAPARRERPDGLRRHRVGRALRSWRSRACATPPAGSSSPSASSLAAGAAQAETVEPGVRRPSVRASEPRAYPLAVVSYAATPASLLTVAAARDYATLIRYAVGQGQEPGFDPGQLPCRLRAAAASRSGCRRERPRPRSRTARAHRRRHPSPRRSRPNGPRPPAARTARPTSRAETAGNPNRSRHPRAPHRRSRPRLRWCPLRAPSTRLVATAPTPASSAGAAKYVLLDRIAPGRAVAGAASVPPPGHVGTPWPMRRLPSEHTEGRRPRSRPASYSGRGTIA